MLFAVMCTDGLGVVRRLRGGGGRCTRAVVGQEGEGGMFDKKRSASTSNILQCKLSSLMSEGIMRAQTEQMQQR